MSHQITQKNIQSLVRIQTRTRRTNTHDDVHDGMVVDSGPPVAEHCDGQVLCHCPHLPHVLVVIQLVEFWDKSGGEKGVVCQCGFLNTTRFGPDVVLSTLSCHEDGLPNLHIVEEAHGKRSHHGSSGPLHVHLLSFPNILEWTCEPIVRRANPFDKLFHVDGIVSLPTLQ